jgi:hypothetical protein
MPQGTCVSCGTTAASKSLFTFQGGTYCEPCVQKVADEAKRSGKPSDNSPVPSNLNCARCGTYSAAGFPAVGKLPLCPACGTQVENWPYPVWLKASLAGLLILLALALVNGRQYFKAGSMMYKGERLIEEGHFAQAIPYLQETVRIAPQSDKAVLLLAKAALKTGDIDTADKAIQGHSGGHFEEADKPEFREVRGLWDRAMKAMEKAEQASKLAKQSGHSAEAAKLMHEAAQAYPELPNLTVAADSLDEGAAFEGGDYDRFLQLAQQHFKLKPNPMTAGAVASAFACKYAKTGEQAYREQSEAMLAQAANDVKNDPEAQKAYDEYAERIRYRLKSREIIDTDEYNRRFRAGQTAQ